MDKRPDHRQLKRRWVRIAFLAILVVLAVVVLAIIISRFGLDEMAAIWSNDFMVYWGAARILITGGNPYDSVTMSKLQTALSPIEQPTLMMWNPPWVIALILPYALLPFEVAEWVWLVVNVMLAIICGMALWRIIAPRNDKRYLLGIIAAVAYIPTLSTIKFGQVTMLMLLGITCFLLAEQAKRDILAGGALALLLIKPHITLLLLAGVGWWALRERRWRVLCGGLAALAAASILVVLVSPEIFKHYLSFSAYLPFYLNTATLGAWLRKACGSEKQWLQLLPLVIGLGIFVGWALHHRGAWRWVHLAPRFLLASIVVAAYGWEFDQVILLPVVVALIVGGRYMGSLQRFVLFSLYVLAQIGMLVQNHFGTDPSFYYFYSLALAGLYTWQQWIIKENQLGKHVPANDQDSVLPL